MKSLLTVPIMNEEKQVIAIVQMINKASGKPFLPTDASNVEVRFDPRGFSSHSFTVMTSVVV